MARRKQTETSPQLVDHGQIIRALTFLVVIRAQAMPPVSGGLIGVEGKNLWEHFQNQCRRALGFYLGGIMKWRISLMSRAYSCCTATTLTGWCKN